MNLISSVTEQSAAYRANSFYSTGTVVSTDPISNTAVVDVGAPAPDGTATYKRVAYSPQQPPQTGDVVTMAHTNVSPHSGVIVAMQVGNSQAGVANNAQVVENGGVSTINGLLNAVILAAGTNITLGTVGQTITINASSGAASPLTTKGDLWGFDTTNDRIPVGTNGQVLTANSGVSLGVAWTTLTYVSSLNSLTGALTLVAGTNITITPSGSNITIAAAGAGVSSMNSLTGALSIVAGANVTVTPSGSTITIAASGGAGTLLYANTTVPSGDTLSNTTLPTFFASSYTFAANSLSAGQVIRVNFAGVYSTISSSPGTLTFSLALGTSTLAATVAISLGSSQSNSGFNGTLHLIVDTTGSSGTVECQGIMFINGSGSAVIYFTNTSAVTVNTTTSDLLELGIQWSVAATGNTITLRQFIAELL